MKPSLSTPSIRDIILVGGGHSHVQVLKAFGMRPEPGVRLTLVCQELETPYSGMLPGCLSGYYTDTDIHIQLMPLARFASARMIHARVEGLDLNQQQLIFADRPPLRYDLLSLNCGAIPEPPQTGVTCVKPIGEFLPKWRRIVDEIKENQSVAIIGSGAGGVELAFAARARLPASTTINLVGETLLAGHANGAARRMMSELKKHHIAWVSDRAVAQTSCAVQLHKQGSLAADYVLWVTDVAAPSWLASTDLDTDSSGFVMVDSYLRSTSHTNVFAAGDVAFLKHQPRPKSGVYAVRAGPVLAKNLRRMARGESLKRFSAQKKYLSLMGTGQRQALATRGNWYAYGRFWWWLKTRIDRAFVEQFNTLPTSSEPVSKLPASLSTDMPEQGARCGGCGAKLAADPLRRVLSRLPTQASARVVLGMGDDAAVLKNSAGVAVLTIDGFRTMFDDPYLFGRIAAHHSLNDIFAMAATPTAALAFVTLPLMSQTLMEEELYQVLSGVTDVLNAHDVPLVGGHSAEGAELGVGLTITGEPGSAMLQKGGLRLGDHLILTKPIGTGVVLAATMQGHVNTDSLRAAQQSMDFSNSGAVQVLLAAGAGAMTDVTGFGLAGHLSEMLRACKLGVSLDLNAIPLLPGIDQLFSLTQSSLQRDNEHALQDYEMRGNLTLLDSAVRALADPQTSGGLLAGVPEEHVFDCLERLRALGYTAADIGIVTDTGAAVIV